VISELSEDRRRPKAKSVHMVHINMAADWRVLQKI